MGRKLRTILAHSHGLESQKISGGGRGVLLDFSFYRTSRDLADQRWGDSCAMWGFPEKMASEDNFRFADNP